MVRSQADNPYDIEQAESDIAQLRGQVSYLGEVPSAQNFNLPGANGATFSSLSVSGTSLANLATATIPANHANAGACYQLDVAGTGAWGTSGTTLQMQVTFAGLAFCTFTLAANAFPTPQSIRWSCKARIYCVTAGSSGTWQSQLDARFSCFNTSLNGSFGSAGASMAATVSDANATTASSTVNETFSLQAAWGATTGSPSIASQITAFSRVY